MRSHPREEAENVTGYSSLGFLCNLALFSLSPQEVPSDEITLDELAQRAPTSGQQDEVGLASQRQSASVAPVDSSVVDAAMGDPPLVISH